jgi:hypothetical protein
MQRSLVKEWVRSGRWSPGAPWAIGSIQFYECEASVARTIDELHDQLQAAALAPQALRPAQAPLAVLAQVSGLVQGGDQGGPDIPAARLLAACGSERWIVELAASAITTARRTPVIYDGLA